MDEDQNDSVKKYVYSGNLEWYTPEVTSLEQMCTTKNCCTNNASIKDCIDKGCANCLLNKTIFATEADSKKNSKDGHRYTLVLQNDKFKTSDGVDREKVVIVLLMNPSNAGKTNDDTITSDDTVKRVVQLLEKNYSKIIIINTMPYMQGNSKKAKDHINNECSKCKVNNKNSTDCDLEIKCVNCILNLDVLSRISKSLGNFDLVLGTGNIKDFKPIVGNSTLKCKDVKCECSNNVRVNSIYTELLGLYRNAQNKFVFSSIIPVLRDIYNEHMINELNIWNMAFEKNNVVNDMKNTSNEVERLSELKNILVDKKYARHMDPYNSTYAPYIKIPVSIEGSEINYTIANVKKAYAEFIQNQ